MDFAKRSIDIRLRLMPLEDAERIKDALICHNQALIIDQNLWSAAKWSMVLTLRDIELIH
ncbi:unnamed protein product, partial [Rotaria socialis]